MNFCCVLGLIGMLKPLFSVGLHNELRKKCIHTAKFNWEMMRIKKIETMAPEGTICFFIALAKKSSKW